MKVVNSSPLRNGRLYSFLEAESTPGHMELSDAPEKIPSDRGSIPHVIRHNYAADLEVHIYKREEGGYAI